jgi:hypothetical protein
MQINKRLAALGRIACNLIRAIAVRLLGRVTAGVQGAIKNIRRYSTHRLCARRMNNLI